MSTLKQIQANRLNATKSTGPRTAEGKSAVRLNALKHGLFAVDPIIPGEDPADFEALRTTHYERFQPAAPEEHVLLACMVRDAWSLERSSNCETGMWKQSMDLTRNQDPARDPAPPLIGSRLVQLQRRIDSAQRNYRRNLELLIKLQAARQKTAPAPKPIPKPVLKPTPEPNRQPQSSEPFMPENGFVLANPEIHRREPLPAPSTQPNS